MISTPKSILEQDINDLFKTKKKNDIDFLFKIVNIILLKNGKNTDMSSLFNLLNDYDIFSQIIYLFGGRNVDFIEPGKLRDTLLLAACYYYRKIKNKSWDEIQSIFGNYKLDKLSLSHKMYNLNLWVKQKIQEEYRKHYKEESEV